MLLKNKIGLGFSQRRRSGFRSSGKRRFASWYPDPDFLRPGGVFIFKGRNVKEEFLDVWIITQ